MTMREQRFEMQSRIYDYQVFIEGNYFPMVYAAEIHDNFNQLSVSMRA